MAAGRYIFRGCVPDGTVDIANVQQGEIIQRQWNFRVNEPPDLQSLIDAGVFQATNVLRGFDGKLYDGEGNWLAEVPEWQAQFNFNNRDYQPAGQKIEWAIPVSFRVTLQFTETVVKDARLLAKIINAVRAGAPDAVLVFQGVIGRPEA